MPSQIATKPAAVARPPKRQRGRLRVAAILETGREVIMEKGYDAATMTEIAARSGTAIGSLYRFFPSKESLADALMHHYAERMTQGLGALAERAPKLTPELLATELVDLMLALQDERSFVIALTDASGGNKDVKRRYREATREATANIIRKVVPRLPKQKAEAMAILLLHVLRVVPRTAEEDDDPATRRAVLAEIRELIRLYLVSAH
jgi:AcrR family transcriptional regulator